MLYHFGAARISCLAAVVLFPLMIHAEVPVGWRLRGDDTSLKGCELATDMSTKHSGRRSMRMTCAGLPVPKSRSLNQSVRADDYRGQRVRLSGWIKPSQVDTRLLLWMRVDSADSILAFDNNYRRPVQGSGDWEKRDVVLDVPQGATLITFGLLLHDSGTVWADDLTLERVGTDVPSTNILAAEKPSNSDRRERHARIYAFSPKQPVNLDFEK
jgi:hypothetical protein